MDLPEDALSLLRWIGFAQRRMAEEWVREVGLTAEQGFVLRWLVDHPGAIQRELAEITRTSAASVSSLVSGLERRGWAERRADDADVRTKRVHATPAGAALVTGFAGAMADIDARILAPLDDEERATLTRLLGKVAAPLPEPSRS